MFDPLTILIASAAIGAVGAKLDKRADSLQLAKKARKLHQEAIDSLGGEMAISLTPQIDTVASAQAHAARSYNFSNLRDVTDFANTVSAQLQRGEQFVAEARKRGIVCPVCKTPIVTETQIEALEESATKGYLHG
jgi:hypothetical protein